MKNINIPDPPTSLVDFILKEDNILYKHFDFEVRYIVPYLDILWRKINPKGHKILNMGIEDRTPRNILSAIDYGVEISHVELGDKHTVEISESETIIWQTDFFSYVKAARKNTSDGAVLWHGPEHLEKDIGEKAIRHAIRVASEWVIVSCPWDRLKGWKSGKKFNKATRKKLGHKSIWTEDDLLKLGFKTLTIGERSVYPSFMLGWRFKNK